MKFEEKLSKTPEEHSAKYLSNIAQLAGSLNINKIVEFTQQLKNIRSEGRTLFIAGNGGSASTASHFATDLNMVSIKYGARIPFRAVSLTDNIALITAIANDIGYGKIFVEQLKNQYRPGDVLLTISASGNSPNVVAAAQWVKEHNGRVLGLLGFDGGKLRHLCNFNILVETPPGEYGLVEDLHLVLTHLVAAWFQGGANL